MLMPVHLRIHVAHRYMHTYYTYRTMALMLSRCLALRSHEGSRHRTIDSMCAKTSQWVYSPSYMLHKEDSCFHVAGIMQESTFSLMMLHLTDPLVNAHVRSCASKAAAQHWFLNAVRQVPTGARYYL